MSRTPRFVALSDVFRMLDDCAKGYTAKEKTHHWWIAYNGMIFQGLPVGDRSSRDPQIFAGKIRAMVRLFGIRDCAATHFDCV